MKGIILAGGSGTRLHPMTYVTSKQLLPIYDKPMIYYPLTTLMLAGIREILIISTPDDLPRFQQLLGNGERWGISLSYAEQPKPGGPRAGLHHRRRVRGRRAVGPDPRRQRLSTVTACTDLLRSAAREQPSGASVFAYHVTDPERYGVVEFDGDGRAISIEEKPTAAEIQLGRHGALFLRRAGRRHRREPEAVRPRRARDHRRQPRLSRDAASCRSSSWAAASPGSTPARPTAWSRPPSSCAPWRSGRASASPARRRSPSISAGSAARQLVALGETLSKSTYGQYVLGIAQGTVGGIYG